MRRVLVALAGLTVILAGLLVHPQAAGAADPVWSYRNQATNRCMDDTNEGGFRTWPCNGTNPQRWTVHTWNDGTVRFQNNATGRCIYDSNTGFRTMPCDSSTNQSWWVKYWNDGTRRFQNQQTGRCIRDGNDGFFTWTCDASTNQSWFRQ